MEVLDRENLGVKFWMDGFEYFIGYAIVLSIDIYESLLISRVCVCVLIYSQSSPFSLPLFRNNTEEIFRTSSSSSIETCRTNWTYNLSRVTMEVLLS